MSNTITIIKTDEFQIIKEENNFFTLILPKPNRPLLLSLLKSGILIGATISDQYKSITFRANKVSYNTASVNKYETATKILHDIAKQYEYLISKENKIFYRFDPENIISINDNKFIYINSSDLLDIQNNEQLILSTPFTKNPLFDSPEVSKITQIPSIIHYKAIYYSLAKYILFFLFDSGDVEEAIKNLQKIKGTKLFYTLERCLTDDPKQRSILFI
jgi:hypothetical protein